MHNLINSLKKSLGRSFWRQSVLAALLSAIVIWLTILIGVIAQHVFDTFWFGVFLLAFSPTWLGCFGIVVASRFRWHELMFGSFASVFVMLYLYMRGIDDVAFRFSLALLTASGGAFMVTMGYAAGRLGQRISQDIKRALPREWRKGTTIKG